MHQTVPDTDQYLTSQLQIAARFYLNGPHAGRRPRNRYKRGRIQQLLRVLAQAIIWLHVAYFGTVLLLCGVFTIINPGVSSLMVYRFFTGTTHIKPVKFIPNKQLTNSTKQIFIQLEDHDFYDHLGVSPGAIRDAMRLNKIIGRTVFGGSTITQQLARNLFLIPEKSYIRKYFEAGTAIMLELTLGKKRILELYLNYIEFGPGVFGLGQAARYHYGQPFSELSYEQRVRLGVIITSPLRYTVESLWKSRGMRARYQALMGREQE